MLLQYVAMFTVPTAVAVCFWKPASDDEIRERIVRDPANLYCVAIASFC